MVELLSMHKFGDPPINYLHSLEHSDLLLCEFIVAPGSNGSYLW